MSAQIHQYLPKHLSNFHALGQHHLKNKKSKLNDWAVAKPSDSCNVAESREA